MQVESVECQLAQVQLKRYLQGEELPADLMAELERHLKTCGNCKEAAQRQRDSLAGMLGKPAKPKLNPWAVLASEKAAVTPTGGKPNILAAFKNSKTIALSGALALVLIAMSTILRDPTKLLGPKAKTVASSTTTPPAEEATTEPEKPKDEKAIDDEPAAEGDLTAAALGASGLSETTDEPTKDELDTEPVKEDPPKENPAPESTTAPKPTAKTVASNTGKGVPGTPTLQGQPVVIAESQKPPVTSAPRTTTRRTTRRRPTSSKPKATAGKVRVYDSSGKPIH